MLRPVNHKQLTRIFKGEDLEFRITHYPVKVSGTVEFDNLTFPFDLKFNNSHFDSVIFRNCRFQGDLSLNNSTLQELTFEGCIFKDVEVEESKIQNLKLSESLQMQKFSIGGSSINTLLIERNEIFEAIEVACENNIVSAHIEGNGNSTQNSFKSTIYICPERFDSMVLKNNISEILHVGTIGEYSSFEIENYNANLVLFSNCNGTSSKVRFQNLQPIDPFIASVCIVNSDRIVELNQKGIFNQFRRVKRYKQEVDDYKAFRNMAI